MREKNDLNEEYLTEFEKKMPEAMPSRLNQDYLNVVSGEPQRIDIESLVKPINFCDLKQFGIQVVVDIQLIEQETN
jgi:hypothetical protein